MVWTNSFWTPTRQMQALEAYSAWSKEERKRLSLTAVFLLHLSRRGIVRLARNFWQL
ncbi:hypothetical protein DPMN_138622 [Dreissena polymorpha]|uniref:Uncharacterized protein n=1 Tax=Dreissena polymorpha TaxID=45954 RepID=A0A9D4JK10_DREPO|nr:hypothetical protein DPMN_138622 [Dreissena polymorpha]